MGDSLSRLDRRRASVEVESRGTAPTAGVLAAISRQVSSLDGKTINIGVSLAGGVAAVAALRLLGSRMDLLSRTVLSLRNFALPLGLTVLPAIAGAAGPASVAVIALAGALTRAASGLALFATTGIGAAIAGLKTYQVVLSQVITDTRDAWVEANEKAAEALEKQRQKILLTSEANAFNAAINRMILALTRIEAKIGQEVFPTFTRWLDTTRGLLPALTPPLMRLIRGVTDAADGFFRLATSGPGIERIQRVLNFVADAGIIAARQIGNLASIALRFAPELIGPSRELLRFITEIANAFTQWTRSAEGTRAIEGILAGLRDGMHQSLSIITDLVGGFFDLFSALSETGVGQSLLDDIVTLADNFSHVFDRGTQARQMLEDFARRGGPILTTMAGIGGALVSQFVRISDEVSSFREEGERFTVLQQIFQAIQRNIGPVADTMIQTFKDLGPLLPDLIDNLAELFETFAGSSDVLVLYVEQLNFLLNTFNDLPGPVKNTVANLAALALVSQSLGGGALVTLAGALGGVLTNFLLMRRVGRINTLLAQSGQAAQQSGRGFQTATRGTSRFSRALNAIGRGLRVLPRAIARMAAAVGRSMGRLLRRIARPLGRLPRLFARAARAAGRAFSRLPRALGRAVGQIGRVVGRVGRVFSRLSRAVARAVRATARAFGRLPRTLGRVVGQVGRVVQRTGRAFQRLARFAARAVQATLRAFSRLARGIARATTRAARAATRPFQRLARTLGRAAQRGVQAVIRSFSRLAGQLGRFGQRAVRAISRPFGRLPQTLGRIASRAIRALVRPFSRLGPQLGRAVGRAVRNAGRALGRLPQLIGRVVSRAARAFGRLPQLLGRVVARAGRALGRLAPVAGRVVGRLVRVLGPNLGRLVSRAWFGPGGWISLLVEGAGAVFARVLTSKRVLGWLSPLIKYLSGAGWFRGVIRFWKNLPKSISDGIIGGLKATNFGAAGAHILEQNLNVMNQRVKKNLQIDSPSRLYESFGRSINEGLAKGLKDSQLSDAQFAALLNLPASDAMLQQIGPLNTPEVRKAIEDGVVEMGEVSKAAWEKLLALGFKGDPTDAREALIIPGGGRAARPVSAAAPTLRPQRTAIGAGAGGAIDMKTLGRHIYAAAVAAGLDPRALKLLDQMLGGYINFRNNQGASVF